MRHSVFVVGAAGTGKSQVLRSLHKTYQIMKRRPVWTDLNPKAVTNDELFGIINPATREWKDGKSGSPQEKAPAFFSSSSESFGQSSISWGERRERGTTGDVNTSGKEEISLGWKGTSAFQIFSLLGGLVQLPFGKGPYIK